jgi:hypothetical protein
MSKTILIAAAAFIGVSAVATAYYVSSYAVVASDVPPISVNAQPAAIINKLKSINIDDAWAHYLNGNPLPLIPSHKITLNLSNLTDSEVVFDLKFLGDEFLQFKVDVSAVNDLQSEIKISTVLGKNKFTSNEELQSFDIKLLEACFTVIATEIISSKLNTTAPTTLKKFGKEVDARYKNDKEILKMSGSRIISAFKVAYKDDLKRIQEDDLKRIQAKAKEDTGKGFFDFDQIRKSFEDRVGSNNYNAEKNTVVAAPAASDAVGFVNEKTAADVASVNTEAARDLTQSSVETAGTRPRDAADEALAAADATIAASGN